MSSLIQRPFPSLPQLPLVSPVLLAVSLAAVPTAALVFHYLRSSYLEYISNGPGGVGQHVYGWLQTLALRFVLWTGGVNQFDTSIYIKANAAGETWRWLADDELPQRKGPRPALKLFPLPQRHLVSLESPTLAASELSILTSLAAAYPSHILFANSHLETFGPALHLSPTHPTPSSSPLNPFHRGEFAHIHLAPYTFPSPLPASSSDGTSYTPTDPLPGPQSLHVTLSPRDAKLAIEKGWAVRHPASGEPPRGVPRLAAGYVLVYAPRDDNEVEVVRKLVRASAGFVAGVEEPLAD